VSILAFVTSWNAYLLPLLVLNDPDQWTLPLGVANWSTQYTQDTSKILAFTALSMLPALLFFVLAERRIVGGLTGAVKGLLGGVGADPTKWGAPSDPEPGHQDRPPVGVNVLHMKRRLTDQEITVLPGGLSVPAVDPE